MADLLSWFDPTGVETTLNGETFYTIPWGKQNMFMPPLAIVSQQVPLQPGRRAKYTQIDANDPKVPLYVSADDEATLALARRQLVYAMNPLRGVGFLRATAQDNTLRDLNCVLVDGLRGDESSSARGMGWFLAGLEFEADDPFWYDSDFTFVNFSTAAPVNFLATPFLGMNISSSGIASSFSVFNSGDVEAWPIWTITGPGNTIVLTNNTTGKVLALSGNGGLALTAGQVLTIDTRPGAKTITREDGSNKFAFVAQTSSLWSLPIGNNSISLSILGTTGASGLQLQYKQRYFGV